jgi:hypothetical protein
MSQSSSLSVVSDCGLDDWDVVPCRTEDFAYDVCIQTSFGAFKWVPGVLSLGVKCRWGMTLTTQHLLMLRSTVNRNYTFGSSQAPLLCIVGQLYIQILQYIY